MYAESGDLHVTKLVDFIARIPEHLDLHFYDYSTILYLFYKFTGGIKGITSNHYRSVPSSFI